MTEKNIRLESSVVTKLKIAFRHQFAPTDHLWLFGSQVNIHAKGGDIDLYIETTMTSSQEALERKLNFLCELYETIGLQKIDVVLNIVNDKVNLPIYDIAQSEGIQLL